ncbi:GntR family transcriptional regulator [Rhodococcus sp. PAE-6]|uniref:GntR family transcriptional regulator n=1 Tax=Rhodococcus TaxID=1827 RepID=UPI0018D2C1BB|nr:MULTISPECIES: GntR family transcriptional regulator [Rhodococcus]MCT7293244.1 GntR family transcriptional regulator [Rhodococcus sp. PAE-6]
MAAPTRSPGTAADHAAASQRSEGAVRRRPQLSDEVAGHLRGSIMSGVLRPGDFIRLDETAVELGVSVTPVREALLTLRGEGMVESAPNRGYRVSPLTRGDIDDIFWLQGQIAVELALRAVDRATPADLECLSELSERLRRLVVAPEGVTPDIERIADAEFDFHRELNRIADSPKLAWFLNTAARTIPYRLYARDAEWGMLAIRSHTKLIEAIAAQDHSEVITQTLVQFEDAAARLVAHRERAGVDSPPG